MSDTYKNNDGLINRFGAYHGDPARRVNRPYSPAVFGSEKELVVHFDLEHIVAGSVSYTEDLNNDGSLNGFTKRGAFIPAGAVVRSCELYVSEAAAGGTSIVVGAYEEDGSVIDADGFNTTILTAAITAGAGIEGGGADIGEAVSTSLDSFVGIAATGTFTAGKGKLVIVFVDGV